jgi:hypothetical protein
MIVLLYLLFQDRLYCRFFVEPFDFGSIDCDEEFAVPSSQQSSASLSSQKTNWSNGVGSPKRPRFSGEQFFHEMYGYY